MSNIYIQEPPTEGKVLLETTAGDIDIELWSKECPKACRNFVQLCMEGYYDNTIFHRLVKGFIVQGGDPTGTGHGGNSIWGKPFKDEFHSRLRFTRRGLVAMANAGRDDNGSQFFFTLGITPELQNKHTVFAKVGGNTIFNMIKLEESPVDEDEKPLFPHKIIGSKILNNPFDDIVPREIIKREKAVKKKKEVTGTKNFKLLSFGDEAEEESEEVTNANKKFGSRGKSSHDIANDPKLSKEAPDLSRKKTGGGDETLSDDEETEEKLDEEIPDFGPKNLQKLVQERLKSKDSKDKKGKKEKDKNKSDSEEEYYLGKDEKEEKKKKLDAIKSEYKKLRKEMKAETKAAVDEKEEKKREEAEREAKLAAENTVIKSFLDVQETYRAKQGENKKKGSDREAQTLALLAKFKAKVETAKETCDPLKPLDEDEDEESEAAAQDISWLAKSLHFEEQGPVLAKDANLKSDDWFDITDPRNALNKRRRGEKVATSTSDQNKKSKYN